MFPVQLNNNISSAASTQEAQVVSLQRTLFKHWHTQNTQRVRNALEKVLRNTFVIKLLAVTKYISTSQVMKGCTESLHQLKMKGSLFKP